MTALVLSASISTSAQDTVGDVLAEARTRRTETPREERLDAPRRGVNERLSGSFLLAEPMDDVQRRVDRAIVRAVQGMSFLTRGYATSRLRQANRIERRLRTEVIGSRVTMTYGDVSYTTPNASWQDEREPNGDPVRLRQVVRGNRIEQVFRSDEGQKRTVYRFSRNGDHVTLDITVTGARLPRPLHYSLRYERAERERSTVAAR